MKQRASSQIIGNLSMIPAVNQSDLGEISSEMEHSLTIQTIQFAPNTPLSVTQMRDEMKRSTIKPSMFGLGEDQDPRNINSEKLE